MVEYNEKELPRVLSAPNTANSISMERALKQIIEVLEVYPDCGAECNDRVDASLDDARTMLAALKK